MFIIFLLFNIVLLQLYVPKDILLFSRTCFKFYKKIMMCDQIFAVSSIYCYIAKILPQYYFSKNIDPSYIVMSISLYDHNRNVIIWSSVCGHLGCFSHFFVIVKSASAIIFLCLFPIVHVQEFLSVTCLGNELLGYSTCEFSTSGNSVNLFTRALVLQQITFCLCSVMNTDRVPTLMGIIFQLNKYAR